MAQTPVLLVESVSYRYSQQPATRWALSELSFDVATGELFGLLGPNGGGKSTFFRLLATTLPLQHGRIRFMGLDVAKQPLAVRSHLAVVFQSPSVDGKLTVEENLRYHGLLYGLTGAELQRRLARRLQQFGLLERRRELVATLSGGLARRVELAKGLLTEPRLLLLDEPGTGLDPGARWDFWQVLQELRQEGVTILLTTHLMEEAARCDRVGILDRGRLVALGTPDALCQDLGGQMVTLTTADPEHWLSRLQAEGLVVQHFGQRLRFAHTNPYLLLSRLAETATTPPQEVLVAQATLEDVFIQRTGHAFWRQEGAGHE